jgi:hypothetical protein
VIGSGWWARWNPAQQWREVRVAAGPDAGPGRLVPLVLRRLLLNVVLLVFLAVFGLGFAVIILGLGPGLVAAFTDRVPIILGVGLPLSALLTWAIVRFFRPEPSHRTHPPRPSTPTDRGRGDLREYEVRYGFRRALLAPQVMCAVFVAIGWWAWPDAPWVTLLAVVFFGAYWGWLVLGALLRAVAIRVGAAGIVLCDRPVGGEPHFVPWSEVTAVVVFELRKGGLRRYDRVGVVRPREPIGVDAYPTREALDRVPAPHIWPEPTIFVTAYAWRLDVDRLRRAVELNAPDVRLIDMRE